MPESIEERVKEIIVDELGVEEYEVIPSARLIEELGMDSLDCVELTMRCEEEFNVEIPDDDAPENLRTVQGVIDYLTKLTTNK